jgi:glycosyltransferase involved in cell wall biosynthesis
MLLPKRLNDFAISFRTIKHLRPDVLPSSDLLAVVHISFLIHKHRPSLVHIHSSKAGIIARLSCFLTRTPCIFTVHGWSFNSTNNSFLAKVYTILELLLATVPRKIICVSHADYLQGIKIGIPKHKLLVIQNTSNLFPKPISKPLLLTNRPIKLLTVARLDSQKDHAFLFYALSKLPKKYSWTLDIVGDGPLLPTLLALAHELSIDDKLKFLGFQSHLEPFYMHSDLFLLCSNWEAFPITILEAMSASLPVISSDTGGCNEIVLPGFNGFLFSKTSHLQLVSILVGLFDEPQTIQSLSVSARTTFDRAFSPSIFNSLIFKVYSSILQLK